MMRAGRLNRRITLQSATEVRDAYGQAVKTWADVATVWAEVMPLSGREREIASQTAAETNVKFRIRWRSDITADMRVVYGGRNYEIVEPPPPENPDVLRFGLSLMCREVA